MTGKMPWKNTRVSVLWHSALNPFLLGKRVRVWLLLCDESKGSDFPFFEKLLHLQKNTANIFLYFDDFVKNSSVCLMTHNNNQSVGSDIIPQIFQNVCVHFAMQLSESFIKQEESRPNNFVDCQNKREACLLSFSTGQRPKTVVLMTFVLDASGHLNLFSFLCFLARLENDAYGIVKKEFTQVGLCRVVYRVQRLFHGHE
ncbi:hypothetical protein [Brazilian marseillevirus]|uniref:hypothetical protein n=1 Tax=Brazilian marseillevirus TaxID=1813599 RepID=UPI000785F0BF|nr:hypothetical protein A3303_gp110 [Brazilian marseillevirus]AMQ10618.1 hypothetical protein [Brazilian marseillevirus]